jgi:hypothetical protein
MNVTLQYIDGCPNWRTTYDRLREALRAEGMADIEPVLDRVESVEDAERLRFAGSPTILAVPKPSRTPCLTTPFEQGPAGKRRRSVTRQLPHRGS